MIVIGSNTSDNGPSCFTEDVSHFMELRQNRQLALLERSAKNQVLDGKSITMKRKYTVSKLYYLFILWAIYLKVDEYRSQIRIEGHFGFHTF